MPHFSRDDFLRIVRNDQLPYVLSLDANDTAYDPETGDTLLGGVTVTYDRGTFPGPTYIATISDQLPAAPPAQSPVSKKSNWQIISRIAYLELAENIAKPQGLPVLAREQVDALAGTVVGTALLDGLGRMLGQLEERTGDLASYARQARDTAQQIATAAETSSVRGIGLDVTLGQLSSLTRQVMEAGARRDAVAEAYRVAATAAGHAFKS
jgi:hypothetical protein